MTIKQNEKTGVCYSVFKFDGQTHCFSFNGKKGQPLITSKREAREREAEIRRQMRDGQFVADSPLQNFARFYKEVFLNPETWKVEGDDRSFRAELTVEFDTYYGENLVAAFGHKKLAQISTGDIERFLMRLSRTKTVKGTLYAPVTVRMHFERLNQVFNLARRERLHNANPCADVKPQLLQLFPRWIPRERYLNQFDPEEESKLFAKLDGRLQTLCALLLQTGLRPPREILLAEKRHANVMDARRPYTFTHRDGAHLEGQTVILPPKSLLVVHGKAGRTRVVPLNSKALGVVEVLVADAATGDYLFANREGEPFGSIKKGFQAACRRAKITNLRPYDLRHTFATRLQERYVPNSTISALLGHVRPVKGFGQESRVTVGYSHTTWEAMCRAVESLEYEPSEIVVFGAVSRKSREKSAPFEAEQTQVKAG
jgi:integrase